MKRKTPDASTAGESNQAFQMSPKSYPVASPSANPISNRAIAESVLREIEWHEPDQGYCRCPGFDFHTQANGKKDCLVMVDRVPTIFCVHSTCRPEIERMNHELRSAIGKAKFTGDKPNNLTTRPSPEEIQKRRERDDRQRLKLCAERSLPHILETFASDQTEFYKASPVCLVDDPRDDWKLLLQLFQPDDVLWIGDKFDSGSGHESNFRPVGEWLNEPAAPAQLICPNSFKSGVNSRCNENVLHPRFLVIESDTLKKPEICSVFRWCRQFLRLRAIVDTASKSFHGWFDYPSADWLEELKIILPQVGCDPALFKPSQPVRLPGAKRANKIQSLLFLDLEGAKDE